MKTVTFDIANTDGSPRELGIVIVRLVAGTPGAVVGDQVRLDEVEVHLDDQGQGEIELATNDVEVEDPEGTYYTATVKGSSPTVYRCFELTDDLPDTVAWTHEAMQLDDPAMPDTTVSAARVRLSGPHGVFDPTTLEAAVVEACEQTDVPDEVVPVVVAAIEASVDLVDLTDPTSLANLIANAAELSAHAIVGVTVLGINVAALSAALAEVLNAGASPPAEPADPTSAVWVRTVGDLRSFVDFRLFPDGPIDGTMSNGVGGSDPLTVRSFASLGYPFQPALVDAGAVVSDQTTESSESDPTPKTGFTLYAGGTPVAPTAEGRIEWGHGGIVEGNGDLEDYVPTNVAISDVNGDAYLMGVVLGRFDTDADTTDPGNPVSARMRLIRDDLTAPTTVASDALPRLPRKGDRFAFTWDADGHLAGHMNGTEIVSVTETTHDISTFDRIGMPMHQGSDAVDWNDGYYTRVEWFGISSGDEITGDLGAHVWTADGWQPAGPQARPVLGTGGGAVSSVAGRTGAVVLEPADITALSTARILGRTSSGAGAAEQLTAAQVRALLGTDYGLVEGTVAEGISVVKATWRSGSYYGPSAPRTINAGQTLASGAVRAMPFYNPVEGRTIDQLAVDVQSGSAGSGKLYVCADDGTGYPGEVLASTTMSTPTTSTRATGSASLTLPRGLLWLVAHGTGTTWSALTLDGQSPLLPARSSYSTSGSTCWYATGAGTSTLTEFPAGGQLDTGVLVLLRAA